MTDQELLQAIGQIVETALDNRLDAKLEPLRKDIRELKDSVVSMDVRINQLEAITDMVSTRMDRLEFNMDRLESRLKLLERGTDQLGIRMDKLEAGTDGLKERVHGIRVYLENDQKRTLNLLFEGQQSLWDRFVPLERLDPLEERTQVLEATARYHSEEIRELQLRLA